MRYYAGNTHAMMKQYYLHNWDGHFDIPNAFVMIHCIYLKQKFGSTCLDAVLKKLGEFIELRAIRHHAPQEIKERKTLFPLFADLCIIYENFNISVYQSAPI